MGLRGRELKPRLAAIAAIRKVAEGAGASASVKLVAPKVGGARLSNGKRLAADGQLVGTPSVIFDAVAVILATDAGDRLCKEGAAREFVRNAFGHLKAIAVDDGARAAEIRRHQARQGGGGCRRHQGVHHRGEDAVVGAQSPRCARPDEPRSLVAAVVLVVDPACGIGRRPAGGSCLPEVASNRDT